ncbi:hypothetical protein ABZY68_08225 [Streptomyces sp. NPDC006482]|uniref:hypothetical protein n=1 Tax=unclassified Streptomyces TaxID=2593676 RepID=UPI0022566B90|nr:hypothetical protein [Streptomyces sp. NBC_00094]MCX5395265.1 hypothetical protein [Streptomyces sp. NBC_00094]
MLIGHNVEDGVLHLEILRDLDISSRAAATLEIEMLLFTHRPYSRVRVQLPTCDPSPASLSVLARARRLCGRRGIPLAVVGPPELRGRRADRLSPVREV